MFQFGSRGRSRVFMTNREQYRLAALIVAATLGAVIAARLVQPEKLGRVFLRQPAATELPEAPAAEIGFAAFFPGVNAEALGAVTDDRPFRDDDRAAYFNLFDVLRKGNAAELARAAVPITFAQLRKQSAEYRGRLVTVSGRIRGVLEQDFPPNEHNYRKYQQLWIQPDDAPAWPVTVHCLELPPGFPTGKNLDERVKISGFFLKRVAYLAGDGMRTAPLLLASTFAWQPPPPASERSAEVSTRSLVILGVGSVAIFVWMIVWDRRRRRRQPMPWMPAPQPDFETLKTNAANQEQAP